MNDSIPQQTPLKQCTKCKAWLPATKDNFSFSNRGKDGLCYICKKCDRARGKTYRHKNIDKTKNTGQARRRRIRDERELQFEQEPNIKKMCTNCLKWLPSTPAYFHRDSSNPGGLKHVCKTCRNHEKGLNNPPRVKPQKIANIKPKPQRVPKTRVTQSVKPTPKTLPDGMKQCTKCLQVLPATMAYFFKRSASKDGMDSHCKKCKEGGKCSTFGIERIVRNEDEKQCNRCLKVLPKTIEYFYKEARGFQSVCKLCKYEIHQEHRVEISIQNKARRQANPKKYKQQDREYIVYRRNRQARQNSIQGKHTAAQIRELLKRQHYKCYYAACDHSKFEKHDGRYIYHVDHTFPLSRVIGTDIPANDISYLVLTCPSCNLSKHDKFPWEWPEGGRLF